MTRDANDTPERPRGVNRRGMLARVGVATAAAVAGPALLPPAAEAFRATPQENAPRYKDSAHVKTYYRVVGR